jgi:hypothetical protein
MKRRLSIRQWGLLGLVILGLVLQLDQRYHHRKFAIDAEVSMVVASNLQKGEGRVTFEFNPEDASQPNEAFQSAFMPGYAYILRFFYVFTGDWLQASWWVEFGAIFGYWLLLISWVKRLDLWGTDRYHCWLWLFFGFSVVPLHYLPVSDLLGFVGILAGSLALLGPGSMRAYYLSWWQVGLSLCCFGFALWMRYGFLPFLALVPLTQLWYWWQNRSRMNLWRTIAIGGLSLGVLLLILGSQGLSGTLADARQNQLFPAHLLYFEPFPFKAFFYYGLSHELSLKRISPLLPWVLKTIAFVLSGGLVWLLLQRTDGLFRFLMLATWGLNLGLITYFSLTVPAEDWTEIGFWTFLMETRYYVPSMWFVLIGSFWIASHWPAHRALRFFLMGVASVALLFGLFAQWQRRFQPEKVSSFSQSIIPEVYQQAQNAGPSQEVPLLMASYLPCRMGEVWGFSTAPYAKVIQQEIWSSRSVQIQVLLPPGHEQTEAEVAWTLLPNTGFLKKVDLGEWWDYRP